MTLAEYLRFECVFDDLLLLSFSEKVLRFRSSAPALRKLPYEHQSHH